jgi:hypothetical protein
LGSSPPACEVQGYTPTKCESADSVSARSIELADFSEQASEKEMDISLSLTVDLEQD